MYGLVICNKEKSFLKVLMKHFDDLVKRKAFSKIENNIYQINFLGSVLAYEQRKPTEFEIRNTIDSLLIDVEGMIDKNCIVLTGDRELLSTAYIHYEGLVREGLMLKENGHYILTKDGISEMLTMFKMLGK
jgi:hypothetical protein